MVNTRRRWQHRFYTKQELEEAAAKSFSVAQVMRLLGFHYASGGSSTNIKKRLKAFGIDCSHFTGQAHNKGKQSNKRLKPEEVFVLDRHSGRREHRKVLHRTLQMIGVEYKCFVCSRPPIWEGVELVLQVDHISGNPVDCRRDNLRYICPNCHSQTDTFGTKNVERPEKPPKIKVIRPIRLFSPLIAWPPKPRKIPHPNQRKVDYALVIDATRTNNYNQVAKKFGLSWNGVRKIVDN